MRKRLVSFVPQVSRQLEPEWLDLDKLAVVEVSSEEESHQVELALVMGVSGGWLAAEPGEQVIRIIFDQPQRLTRIFLVFEEREFERTQEFVLRWSADSGNSYREIARQQWNFSPPGTVVETEDYRVELPSVTVLELYIVPDKSGGPGRASLVRLRLA
jgi:hypothetical protein